ncbi:androgen-induced 1 [Nesidiocoris tenuis]|uniref:Androgen-induced 1 n=1 Tax=Nesidiocoris tenuis TaxID=355587 RepID=A0ABN7A9D2_9HEMI|nr:androgen-induced 1 [Nesidiocoris tenuis]
MTTATPRIKRNKPTTKLAPFEKKPTESSKKGKDFLALRRILHAVVLISNVTTLVYFLMVCVEAVKLPIVHTDEFLRHELKYVPYLFSLWVTTVQYIYFGMYNVIDFLEIYSAGKRNFHQLCEKMHNIASYLLFTFVFPLSMLVLMLFWSFYFYDRNLIYPPLMDDYIHPYANHVMHTFPVPLSIIYMIMSNKKEPSRFQSFSGLVAFLGFYAAIFMSLKLAHGQYVYIGLEKLPPTQVKWILGFAVVAPLIFHTLGFKINDILKRKRSIK